MNWLDPPDKAFIPQDALQVNATMLRQYLEEMRNKVTSMSTEMQLLRDRTESQGSILSELARVVHRHGMFMDWMKAVHPGVIEAYTKSTEVAQRMEE